VIHADADAVRDAAISNAACIVDENPGNLKTQYAGPYRFSTTDGVEHSVFVFNDTIGSGLPLHCTGAP